MATPSHVDLSVLWVPIMPETSKLGDAMEKAGKDSVESFGKGSSHLGDKIHDSFTKATEKVHDVFDKAGDLAGKAMSDGFKRESKGIETAAAESGSKAGGNLVESFVSKTGGLKDFTSNLGDQIGKNLGGKIGDALKSIPGVDAVTDTLQKVGDKAKEVGDDFYSTKGSVDGFGQILQGLPGKLGAVGAAIGEISFAIAGAVEAAKAIDHLPWVQHWFNDDNGVPKSGVERWADQYLPKGVRDFLGDKLPSEVAAPPAPDLGALGGAGAAKLPGSVAGGGGVGNAGAGSFPLPANVSGSASVAPSGNTVPLTQKPDGTWTSPDPSWAHLIQRESGGNPTIQNNSDSNAAAGDPSQGLFQFTTATWLRMGGGQFASRPGLATPQQQAIIAAKLIQANPSGSDWGAGMSGRENAGGLLAGVGSGSPAGYNFYKDWYPSDGNGTLGPSSIASRGGMSGGGAGGVPTGKQHDPLYVMPADSGPAGAGGSSTQSQAQQLGSGFLGGIAQSVGLDGSVFHSFGGASNPMDFGITKMATGLLNFGLGMAQQHNAPLGGLDARHLPLPGISPASAGSFNRPGAQMILGGGGGGGGMGGMAGGVGALMQGGIGLIGAAFSDLNPGPGAASAHADHQLPAVNYNNNYTINQHGVKGTGVEPMQHAMNGMGAANARYPAQGTVPNSGGGLNV